MFECFIVLLLLVKLWARRAWVAAAGQRVLFTLFGGDATGGEGGDVTLSDNVDMLTPLTTSTHLVVGGVKNALLRLSIFSARQ